MAHRVLERSGVKKSSKILVRVSMHNLGPDSRCRRNYEVKREADDAHYLFSRNLAAHVVERCSVQVPGADISTGCGTDTCRIQLEAVACSEPRGKLGRKISNLMGTRCYVRSCGNTIIHAAPV